MNRFLFFTIISMFFCITPALCQPDYTGHYAVEISGDDSWHNHGMTVRKLGDPVMLDFSLDLNIGPQGRAPMPHERSHLKSVKVGYEGADIVFEIDVVDTTYTFQIYALEVENKPYFAGFVTITEGTMTRTAGFCAVKTRDL
jgi:hypothetical protein